MNFPLLLGLCLLGLFGCTQIEHERQPEAAGAMNVCISECQQEMLSGRNLSHGPCLLDPIPSIPYWVCDVAHSPRLAADNLPENQCSSFIGGQAKHFIEVSPDCKPIKEY